MNKDNPSLEKLLVDYGRFMQRHSPESANAIRLQYRDTLQAITKYIEEEIIGEDEDVTRPSPDFLLGDVYGVERNGLRQEQRIRLEGLTNA